MPIHMTGMLRPRVLVGKQEAPPAKLCFNPISAETLETLEILRHENRPGASALARIELLAVRMTPS